MSMFVVAPTYHHHHHHHDSLNLPSDQLGMGVGLGVIPLLTAAPVLPPPQQNVEEVNKLNLGGGVHQFWQNQPTPSIPFAPKNIATNTSSTNNSNSTNNMLLLQSGSGNGNTAIHAGAGGLSGNSGASSSGGGGTATCQDCGNQAKKDCSHRRCRTCCKSRGFNCATHVKSTWVPASRRRERQLMAAAGTGGGGVGSSGSTSHGVKKARLITSHSQANTTTTTSHTSTSNNTATPPRSFDTSSSHQDASLKESLPGQVRAPAVFKCVRVTAMDDGEDEYAYQAVVRIAGHVFKGFLYDQGVETRDSFPNLSELHLGAAVGGGGGGVGGGGNGRNAQPSSSPIIDPSDVYGASGGGLLGGSSYGNIQ